jgi:NADH-quinone oxidoreductase subunit L
MNARDVLDLAWLIPALPLAGAGLLFLFGRRLGEPAAGWVATGALVGAFALSVACLVALVGFDGAGRAHLVRGYDWITIGGFRSGVGLLVDPLSITWALLVTGVGSLIHLYAVGYMHGDARYGRFFATFNLFAAAMLVLVLADNFLLAFVGWEGVGLCSYLLIGHWSERPRAATAGVKAFVTNRVGDAGFLVAMFLIFGALGSLDYAAMREGAAQLPAETTTAIALALFLACMGKSAQILLHLWLPDAMEGPTPVSALIHAATMVTAGVYLVCRAHPFFERHAAAGEVVALVGALTALLAGTAALVQVDVKRVLAYSTISQLGYMFLAVGVGAYAAAVFFVVVHALYKAALFLGAGTVIHATGDTQDLRLMGGLRRYLPLTAAGFVASWLALVGVPPLSGFWAKDEVLAKALFAGEPLVFGIGLAAVFTTGLYLTREALLVFFGNERFRRPADLPAPAHDPTASPTVDYGTPPGPPPLADDPHEPGAIMTLPVLVLGGGAVVGGFLNLPFTQLEVLTHWLEPAFEGVKEIKAPSFAAGAAVSLVSVAVATVALALTWRLYRRGLTEVSVDPLDVRLGPLGRLFGHAWYYDEAVTAVVGGPARRAAERLDRAVDSGGIDRAVGAVAAGVARAGTAMRALQGGFLRRYALGVLAGTVVLLGYAILRAGAG